MSIQAVKSFFNAGLCCAPKVTKREAMFKAWEQESAAAALGQSRRDIIDLNRQQGRYTEQQAQRLTQVTYLPHDEFQVATQQILANQPVVLLSEKQLQELFKIKRQAQQRKAALEKQQAKIDQTKAGGIEKWLAYEEKIRAEDTRRQILNRYSAASTPAELSDARALNARKLKDIQADMLRYRADATDAFMQAEIAWQQAPRRSARALANS